MGRAQNERFDKRDKSLHGIFEAGFYTKDMEVGEGLGMKDRGIAWLYRKDWNVGAGLGKEGFEIRGREGSS